MNCNSKSSNMELLRLKRHQAYQKCAGVFHIRNEITKYLKFHKITLNLMLSPQPLIGQKLHFYPLWTRSSPHPKLVLCEYKSTYFNGDTPDFHWTEIKDQSYTVYGILPQNNLFPSLSFLCNLLLRLAFQCLIILLLIKALQKRNNFLYKPSWNFLLFKRLNLIKSAVKLFQFQNATEKSNVSCWCTCSLNCVCLCMYGVQSWPPWSQ